MTLLMRDQEKKKMPLTPIFAEEADFLLADEEFLQNCREEEEQIRTRRFAGITCEGEDFSYMRFSSVKFQNCRFWNCSFAHGEFADVLFESCDLSGCDFDEGYMERIIFHSCKGVGAKFTGMVLKHLYLEECNFEDANFDSSRLEHMRILRTRMDNGNLTACRCKQIFWSEASLKNASFFKTSLRGMDLSDSEIGGLTVSDDNRELSGVIVDLFQAAELAKKMGIIIKKG